MNPVVSYFRDLKGKPAAIILLVTLALTGTGIVMIYSSSWFYAEKLHNSPYYYLKRHLISLGVGIILFRLAAIYPYERYKKLVPLLMGVSFVLMVLVLIPGVGAKAGNARRWIRAASIGFQPSEMLKITLIIWAAGFLESKRQTLGYFSKGLLPSLIVLSGFCFLLILQPDFGTAVLISITLLLMVFAAGVRPSHMLVSLVGFSIIGTLLILGKAYRLRRITGFLDPWADPLDSGFQLIQSFIAFSLGGLFGRGLGNSRQKLFFLPESHTDFIFSIMAEEIGFIGVSVTLALFVILMLKGFETALRCRDNFGRNLAFGITTIIFTQTIFHVGVVVGLLPTKGIPLPFVSYGGSSLAANLYMIGVLINIAGKTTDTTQKT